MTLSTEDRVAEIMARLPEMAGARRLIALSGPPGTGKSTVAEALCHELRDQGEAVSVVPMDGFHLDNSVLEARGLLSRKGAPETFDAAGFISLIERLKAGGEVVAPIFDRARDIAIAGASVVPVETRTVIVEGNYLMFDEDPWRALAPLWDLALFIDASEDDLRARLVRRWRDHGHDDLAAVARAEANDLPNARRIRAARLAGAVTL